MCLSSDIFAHSETHTHTFWHLSTGSCFPFLHLSYYPDGLNKRNDSQKQPITSANSFKTIPHLYNVSSKTTSSTHDITNLSGSSETFSSIKKIHYLYTHMDDATHQSDEYTDLPIIQKVENDFKMSAT